jgi:hypothetical protein
MHTCKESPLREASKQGFSGNVSTDQAMMRDHERISLAPVAHKRVNDGG